MSPLTPDLLIVELGERLSVAACGSLLAELGATVVLVEAAGATHPAAGKGPHRATMSAGKLSLALDPNDPQSVDRACRLIGVADAIITSSDLDFAWPTRVTAAIEASASVCDVTAFAGHAMPAPMSDGLMQAMTGTMDTTGDSDLEPTLTRAPVMEITAGIYAAAGILLARLARQRYGVAQNINLSLFDCAMSMMTTFIPRYLTGGEPKRIGNHHASMSPWNAYRAKDGWVMICSGSNDQWKRIATLLGKPELGTDPRYDNATARVRYNHEIDQLMEEWTQQFSVKECLDRFNAVTIPCGPVSEVADLFGDSSLLHRQMIRELCDPITGQTVRVPGVLFRGSRSRGVAPASIPKAGADRDAIEKLINGRTPSPHLRGDVLRPVLDGLRVLEIGQYTTAPLTARQLGAFGADVIKVEPPGGEPARSLPPHREDQSLFFTLSNADKRGLVIDLRKDDGKKLLTELIKNSDVLVENMKPGALARFGFSPQELERLNPRLIYCAISGFGLDSPNASLGAMDTTIQGMSGIMDLTRCQGTPFKVGLSIADIVGGQLGLTFILAALAERERTGRGQFIDLSMQDAAAWIIRTEWNGENAAIPLVFPCEDGYVACHVDDAGKLPAAVGNLTRQMAVDQLAARGHAAAPVLRLSEALKRAEIDGRNIFVNATSPTGVEWHLLNCPIKLDTTPARVARAMGPLGCDTQEVLSDWQIAMRAG